ncbi:MAG: CDP-alcohol phosphatidyltransferase family protein [Gammaproteobacteria bacterium]
MAIGLYQLKYPVRRLIQGILPMCKNISPNLISSLLIPIGIVTAYCYLHAANGHPDFYLIAIALCVLRMFFGTLDGLVAEHFNKTGPVGEIMNRLTPEVADVMVMGAIACANPKWLVPGVIAMGMSWMITFSGLIGLLVEKPIQSVGPAGQTDRLVALCVFSLLAYLSSVYAWHVDFIAIFLYWVIIGGTLTVGLRLKKVV